MSTVELLAPAGSPEALDAAAAEGADAVYLGLKSFNARMRSANFAYSQFEGALRSLHRMGRKLYVTVNTVFEEREADRMYQLLKYLAAIGPDGIIVQDFGVLMMAREFPSLKLHASTQMNIASARGANVLSKYGVSRTVLARELSLEEIKSLRQNTNVELEVFVHGALCVSASGLCLFSSYLGGKSANRGLCTQACRRLYTADDSSGTMGKNAGSEAALERAVKTGGYYFSPCDLSLIGHIGELADAGVGAFKIEGRMKSAEYVGTVVSAYRRVIDSLADGEGEQKAALEEARRILRNDFARPKTEFFFARYSGGAAWLRPEQDGGTGISLGTVVKIKGSGTERRALVKGEARAALAPGDSVRFHRADDSLRKTHKLTHAETLDEASGPAYRISIPESFDLGDSVYLIQTRAMTKRRPPVIPKDLSPYKRQPGRERASPAGTAPEPPAEKTAGKACAAKGSRGDRHAEGHRTGKQRKNPGIPEGLFAAVASIEDLYTLQSVRPAGVILPVNRKTIRPLLEDKTLPFKAGDIIPALDPFFPQEEEAFLAEAVSALEEAGYRSFMLNNPGHFSLLRGKGRDPAKSTVTLIGGPWLYTFNGWAAAFVRSLGAAALVTPLENNRQNLEKTVPPGLRRDVFVTLFAWPPLFRIRDNLKTRYGFKQFEGRGKGEAQGGDQGGSQEQFSLLGGENSTVVIPGEAFSIIDKRPFLETSGFRRFILDFSGGVFNGPFPLKKKLYKEVMKSALEALPLSGTSRFNWKDGFYNPQ